MRRGKEKKKSKQTMQSMGERKASTLLWVKWIESRRAQKLKMKQYFGAEEGEGKHCFCHFSANQLHPGHLSLLPTSISMQQHPSVSQ